MPQKVLTGALARVKFGGLEVGKMRNVRITENWVVNPVKGIGRISPQELATVDWNGNVTCGMYAILTKNALRQYTRNINIADIGQAASAVELFNMQALFDEGIDIELLAKVRDPDNPKTPTLVTIAKIVGAKLTSEGLEVTENAIMGRNGSFNYLQPFLFTGGANDPTSDGFTGQTLNPGVDVTTPPAVVENPAP